MKKILPKPFILFLFINILISNSSHAAQKLQGGSDRGGGDAYMIRRKILSAKKENLVTRVNQLFAKKSASDIRLVMGWFNDANLKLSDDQSNKILQDMQARGLGSDILKTKFRLEKSCFDKNGVSKTATTTMNMMNADICINVDKFVNEFGPYIQDSDFVGLLMHEFSHHFGYSDEDHSFAAAAAKSYQTDSENRNEDGDPLNYLIR